MDDLEINIKISGQILKNSIDLLLDGVESLKHKRYGRFFWSNPPNKSALLAVTTGVELLLKAKIASLDWKQLFEFPQKANKNKILDGSLFSVRFENILGRIESISSIRFSKQTKDDIEQIRTSRNQLVHHNYKGDNSDIVRLIANAIGIYIEFYREHIFEQFCEEIDQTDEIDKELKNEKEYVQSRIQTINTHIVNRPRPYTYYFSECMECLQNVFVLKDKDTALCYYCRHETSVREIAEDHSEFNKSAKICPKCGCESMTALHQSSDEPEAWDCIICGNYENYPRTWYLRDNTRSEDSIRDEFRGVPFIQIQ